MGVYNKTLEPRKEEEKIIEIMEGALVVIGALPKPGDSM
jgi:hypothetical protein